MSSTQKDSCLEGLLIAIFHRICSADDDDDFKNVDLIIESSILSAIRVVTKILEERTVNSLL